MIALGLFSAFPNLIPKVQACGTQIACSNAQVTYSATNSNIAATSASRTFANTYHGDLVIIAISLDTNAGGHTVTGVTDGQGSTYTKAAGTTGASFLGDTEIWWGVVAGTCVACSITVTMTFSGSAAGYNIIGSTFRTTSNVTFVSGSAFCNSGCGPSGNTAGPLSIPANSIVATFATVSTGATYPTFVSPLVSAGALQLSNFPGANVESGMGWVFESGATTITPTWNTGNNPNVGVTVVLQAQATTSSSNTQTVGNCPSKNTGTFTMANNTIYQYSGNALGQEVVNSITFGVASTIGSGSHTIQALVYISSGQSASVVNPLVLSYAKSFVLTSGTANQIVNIQVNIPLNSIVANPLPIMPANLWTVALVGDDHIRLNQSTTSGLTTQTGNPSTGNQPSSFSSGGSANVNKIYLCAVGQYQTVVSITTTSFVAGGTSTTTNTATTTIVSLQGNNPIILSNSNFMLAIIVILGPALLLAGATKSLMGGVFGGLLGIAIGVYIGFVPFYMIVAVVLFSVVVLFVGNRQGGGNV